MHDEEDQGRILEERHKCHVIGVGVDRWPLDRTEKDRDDRFGWNHECMSCVRDAKPVCVSWSLWSNAAERSKR